ncbi:MAG TPA: hypothetical protein PKM78_18505, partial [Anaerolineae bacterium]|nr:hypothetical protein [Anaerolineae bacterium]
MEHLHRTRQLLVVLVVLCLGFQLSGPGAALAAPVGADPQPDNKLDGGVFVSEAPDMSLDSLLARAHSAGSLLVLAELALPQPFVAEGAASPQAALAQRAAIVAASDAVLAS